MTILLFKYLCSCPSFHSNPITECRPSGTRSWRLAITRNEQQNSRLLPLAFLWPNPSFTLRSTYSPLSPDVFIGFARMNSPFRSHCYGLNLLSSSFSLLPPKNFILHPNLNCRQQLSCAFLPLSIRLKCFSHLKWTLWSPALLLKFYLFYEAHLFKVFPDPYRTYPNVISFLWSPCISPTFMSESFMSSSNFHQCA